MSLNKIKQQAYRIVPDKNKIKFKNFYYNNLIFPFYWLKYRTTYGFWDFFGSIAIETTTYCNLRCKFCPNSKYERGLLKNKRLMDINLFKKIINELVNIGYRGTILFHFYGEPLTDTRLPELIKYAKSRLPKSFIQINTNGFLLTISIYNQLINAGVNKFFITQYGNSIPGNIKKIFEYLKNKSKKENKINYRILGKDLGLSNRGGEVKVKNCVDFERPICTYPNTAIHIDYSGNVVLCCNDYHSSIKFGNLNKEKLLDIWNKPNYKKLRKELRRGIFKLPICKRCVGINPQFNI